MNAIYLTLFVSLTLVGGAALLFAYLFAQGNHEQSDRLALLPLLDDSAAPREKAPLLDVDGPQESKEP